MSPGAAITLFQWVSLVGFVLTVVRLFASGLSRRYPYFSAYLLYCTIPVSMSLLMDVRSALYFRIWIFTEPFLWIFNVVVVLELYSLVLEKYKGLYTLGRWSLYASIAASVILSALTLLPRVGMPSTRGSRLYLFYVVIERGVLCSLLIFLLLILFLIRQYPIRLNRNVVVHCIVYSIFFLTNTLALFLHSLFGLRASATMNAVMTGVMAFCVLIWFVFLNNQGEIVQVNASPLSSQDEQKVLGRLDALNSTVLRASRK